MFANPQLRVVLVDDANHPGFCRVIWVAHVAEMTDLAAAERSVLMKAVCKVENALRAVLQPDKINLASLGNMTPHLHWHVIPRFRDDAHFPTPVWGEALRVTDESALRRRAGMLPALRKALVAEFAGFN